MTTNTEDDDLTIHANHNRYIPIDGEPQCRPTLTIHERQKLADEGPAPTGNPPYRSNIWVDRTTLKSFKPRAPNKPASDENR